MYRFRIVEDESVGRVVTSFVDRQHSPFKVYIFPVERDDLAESKPRIQAQQHSEMFRFSAGKYRVFYFSLLFYGKTFDFTLAQFGAFYFIAELPVSVQPSTYAVLSEFFKTETIELTVLGASPSSPHLPLPLVNISVIKVCKIIGVSSDKSYSPTFSAT